MFGHILKTFGKNKKDFKTSWGGGGALETKNIGESKEKQIGVEIFNFFKRIFGYIGPCGIDAYFFLYRSNIF